MRAQIAMIAALAAFSTPAAAQPVSLERLRACLAIEDMTKERLDCFDAVVPPGAEGHRGEPCRRGGMPFLQGGGRSTALLQWLPRGPRDNCDATGSAADTVHPANSG